MSLILSNYSKNQSFREVITITKYHLSVPLKSIEEQNKIKIK
jgi:hypothetical protein